MFKYLKPLPTNGISQICVNHTLNSARNVIKGSMWSLEMIDASSKVQSGVLMGEVVNLGNYDECLDIDVQERWGSFVGQHCITVYSLNLNATPMADAQATKDIGFVPLLSSVCLPSTCSPEDLQYGLNIISKNFIVDPLFCHTKNSGRPLEVIDWIGFSLLAILIILCLLSTLYDFIGRNKERRKKALLMFSWITNGRALFSTRTSGKESLDAIHGLRFFSMCAVVIGHTIALSAGYPSTNLLKYMEEAQEWKNTFVPNLTFAVDTFLVLSGMLVCYLAIKTMEDGKMFNVPLFYLHRFLRLTPLLAWIILLHVSFFDQVASGPLWDYILENTEKKNCKNYWWSTLLNVQNYVNINEACVLQSWFLAVDTQLYWISPIFLLSLRKWPRFGIALTITATISGIVSSFVESYNRRDDPNLINLKFDQEQQLGYSYFHTHTRCASWFVGFLCGYILYRTTDWRAKVAAGTEKLSKVIVTLGWVLAIVALILVCISVHPFLQGDYEYNVLEAAFYCAFARPIWSVCIAWITFACVTGYGGIVNTMLSFPIWRPLGRLTYAMYLFHFDILFIRLGTTKTTTHLSFFDQVLRGIENIIFSILLCIPMVLLVESPFVEFEKLLFRRGAKDKPQTPRNMPETIPVGIQNSNEKTETIQKQKTSSPREE